MRARLHDLSRGLDGGYLLTISTREDVREMFDGLREKDLDVVLKQHREKRSLNANAMCWGLLSKLADAFGETKEMLYLGYVRNCGPYKDFELTESEAKTFCVAWERLGTGWPTEQVDYTPDGNRVVIRAYYGSSTYNKRQMSRLLDLIVDDCKAQGIETMSERELSLLKENWKR